MQGARGSSSGAYFRRTWAARAEAQRSRWAFFKSLPDCPPPL